MPYYNVTIATLYQSCIADLPGGYFGLKTDSPFTRAFAWVEAENIYAVWKIVQTWFEDMQKGKAWHRRPDPTWRMRAGRKAKPLTQALADELIKELDADFTLEKSRFQGREGPEFARLPAYARLAFAQEVWAALKTDDEMEAEAKRRLEEGETFPNTGEP